MYKMCIYQFKELGVATLTVGDTVSIGDITA